MPSAADRLTVADDRQPEAEAERNARITRERVLLEEGFADARAGRVLSGAALDAWLDRFAQGLPPVRD